MSDVSLLRYIYLYKHWALRFKTWTVEFLLKFDENRRIRNLTHQNLTKTLIVKFIFTFHLSVFILATLCQATVETENWAKLEFCQILMKVGTSTSCDPQLSDAPTFIKI